jgi:hypothetical protein
MVNRGTTLGDMGRSEEEIAVYEDVKRRFAAAIEPAFRTQQERAREHKRRIDKPKR